jgi:hypothetical protein
VNGAVGEAPQECRLIARCLPVTIGAMANPSSIVVAIHPIELVIGHALHGAVMAAVPLVIGHAGPSAMVSLLDPLYPLSHMRAKSNDTWYQ